MGDASGTRQAFMGQFGEAPAVLARAPGRVNLIGEHTDYNGGYVLPFAIDRGVEVAAGLAAGNQVTVWSVAFEETVFIDCCVSEPAAVGHWQNYVRGVVAVLRREGIDVPPVNLAVGGDLPVGGGLSSSAALCVALAKALLGLMGHDLDGLTLARAAQSAEREFAGTPCGIMDQYTSVFGRAGHALLLDCRALKHEYVPVAADAYELIVIASGVRHELSDGAYERRVRECEEAVSGLRATKPAVRSLREVTAQDLVGAGRSLSPVAARRARHVVGENERVQCAVAALRDERVEDLGRLLLATHDSLRDDYEVSCDEIERIMSVLRADERVVGARMVGGGFGGSILALVRKGGVPDLRVMLMAPAQPGCPAVAEVIQVTPADGTWCRPC